MKVALISDLHANVPAFEAVLDEIDARRIELTVCLGDIVDLGPEPSALVRLLRARSIPCLMGNHDPFNNGPIVPEEVWRWTLAQLEPSELAWLRALPPSLRYVLEGVKLLCVHGSPRSFDEQILPTTTEAELELMTAGVEFDVLACGHTHVQLQRRLGSRWVVNCGSLGMPFREPFTGAEPPRVLPWAEYAVVSLGAGGPSVELRSVNYDIDEYFRRVRASTMPDPEGWIRAWLTREELR